MTQEPYVTLHPNYHHKYYFYSINISWRASLPWLSLRNTYLVNNCHPHLNRRWWSNFQPLTRFLSVTCSLPPPDTSRLLRVVRNIPCFSFREAGGGTRGGRRDSNFFLRSWGVLSLYKAGLWAAQTLHSSYVLQDWSSRQQAARSPHAAVEQSAAPPCAEETAPCAPTAGYQLREAEVSKITHCTLFYINFIMAGVGFPQRCNYFFLNLWSMHMTIRYRFLHLQTKIRFY